MNPTNTEKNPWYKEPICWLAFSPAIAGVIVGLTLLTIGINNYDGPVHEDYYKEGRAINQSFERDQYARDLDLQASLRFTRDQLQMDLSGQLESFPDQLVVLMENPTRSALDFSIVVQHLQGGRYLGNLPRQPEHDWDIKLYGSEREWRLYARASFPASNAIELRPSQR
ncbi:hypothetical protein SAMN05660443_1654 [Marinospirillum celere]|uniref:Nitrogen fixation protein FixH n=1 Tax=Marinospirillum celere TaxID=1122252 RepID=A0A1I1GVM6_9GAMM|nr:FixH family protein [Marinospirillum celere]SFC15601.1 hypothetical protein SAMN05660443_1654 [Marinospirillum celere]